MVVQRQIIKTLCGWTWGKPDVKGLYSHMSACIYFLQRLSFYKKNVEFTIYMDRCHLYMFLAYSFSCGHLHALASRCTNRERANRRMMRRRLREPCQRTCWTERGSPVPRSSPTWLNRRGRRKLWVFIQSNWSAQSPTGIGYSNPKLTENNVVTNWNSMVFCALWVLVLWDMSMTLFVN